MAYRRFDRVALVAVLALAACKGESDETKPSRGEEERTIVTLQSYVYATPDETSFKVAERIRDQVKSAFGALRSLRVTGSNRAVAGSAGEHFYKEPLILLSPDGTEGLVFRVWFRFSDEVFAPAGLPRGVPLLVGGLHRQPEKDFTTIVTVCTANTAREREYRGRLQSVFDGALRSCQDAILAEQAAIDAARVRLDDPETEIVPQEFDRFYIPVVARLLGRKASQMTKLPRFEPVVPQAGKVVAASVASPVAGRSPGEPGESGGVADGLFDSKEGPRVESPQAIIVPGVGVESPQPRSRREDRGDDESAVARADQPPDPQAEVPVVMPATPRTNSDAQPWRNQGSGRSWTWEDFADSKYWVLWLAVFGLYPLLKRRPGSP